MAKQSHVRDAGSWKALLLNVRDAGSWKAAGKGWIRDSGAWSKFFETAVPTLNGAQMDLCQAGGNPGCDTLIGCDSSGEKHRVGWSISYPYGPYHIAIHRSINGGAFAEAADNVALANPDPDPGCCDELSGRVDGEFLFSYSNSSDLGACTTTYQYRVRVEQDGTDTLVGTAKDTTTKTGCNEGCLA